MHKFGRIGIVYDMLQFAEKVERVFELLENVDEELVIGQLLDHLLETG